MHDSTPPPEVPTSILIADLVHDTAAGDRPAGVRSGTHDRARRLLFAVGEAEVMLQITSHAGGADVAGRVAVGDIPLVGVPVRLEAGGERQAGVTERGGGFWFPADAGATCHLAVDAHGYEVRTADFRPSTR